MVYFVRELHKPQGEGVVKSDYSVEQRVYFVRVLQIKKLSLN